MYALLQVPVHRFTAWLFANPRLLLWLGLLSTLLMSAEAAPLLFDIEAFASGLSSSADISRFNTSNVLAPGVYRVDVMLNGQSMGRREITFAPLAGQDDAQPCLNAAELGQLGVSVQALADNTEHACRDFAEWIPMASSRVDIETLTLDVSIPQIYINRSARGYIDPSEWDNGIDAALLNYNFSAATVTAGAGEDRGYLGLNGGLNLGDWRLRHQGGQAWASGGGLAPYQHTATYLQRSLAAWRSQLTVGDSFSSGQILDGVRVRGITLATDDRMLAQSQQGYAPQVRGIADSNATVTVRQNGYTLYETTVAPGPFVIDDLYPTGYGGDLHVSVTEVDGRRSSFVVPYSVAPYLLRDGASHYSMTLGQLQQYGVSDASPLILQGTLQHGLGDRLSAYGGSTLSQGYGQAKAGLAMSTPIGAFSLDSTHSRTQVQGLGVVGGQSWGLAYNKNLPFSGTHFALGAYRFSTAGYLNLPDALNVRELARQGGSINSYARQKSRLDLTISQQLGAGSLSLYGSSIDYWAGRQGRQTSFTLSYAANWKSLNWNLSAQRSRVSETHQLNDHERSDEIFFGRSAQAGRVDNHLVLTLSMPLGAGTHAPTLSSSLSHDAGDSRGSQHQVGVNGLLGDAGEASYGLTGSRGTGHQQGSSFNAYAGYRSRATSLRAGYAQARDSSQLSVSADGGLIAHKGGVTLAQNLGEASALVYAPDAQGARLGSSGARIDKQGYAVLPALRAFQRNEVDIDPEGMPMDVELKESSHAVVPTLGAVSLVRFETVSGRAVVIKATHMDGKPLPFAAQVFDERGVEIGVIGQAGKAFVRGVADQGRLTVRWNAGAGDQCFIHYRLPPRRPEQRQENADQLVSQCAEHGDADEERS
ncbi:fimbria/pilus outer membrane usher protein [Pseudomonas synxantha]|uniref:fimbria/pilus outer membrane usher protein n=1 Tax=Pseudomonas synxantha TaxID=47883 RepID=UPI0027916D98|nr:fimbria/pilus outer membrane usher protein [Pseudomonas synxantha]MDQ0981263.1 outer membrane usher protein [Pseudomonas synxantha]